MDDSRVLIKKALGDKYEIRELIQSGGMGKIFLGIHKALGRKVAIKIIHQELVKTGDFKIRFNREAKLAASLDHPGIISIYDFGSNDDFDYIIMPFIDGETLRERIKRQGPFGVSEAVGLIIKIAEALHYAHQHNVYHRDIKPANIMFDGRDKVIIADFGISKQVSDGDLTAPDTVLGSPRYMSPEQIKGEPVDARSDLYSLGLVFYEMIAGRHPFHDKDTTSIYYAQAHEIPARPEAAVPDIPKPVGNIIMRLLEKKPENRYAGGEELIGDLRDYQAGKTSPSGDGGDEEDDATVVDSDPAFDDATLVDDGTLLDSMKTAQTGAARAATPAGSKAREKAAGFLRTNKKKLSIAASVVLAVVFLMMVLPGESPVETDDSVDAEPQAAVATETEAHPPGPVEGPAVAVPAQEPERAPPPPEPVRETVPEPFTEAVPRPGPAPRPEPVPESRPETMTRPEPAPTPGPVAETAPEPIRETPAPEAIASLPKPDTPAGLVEKILTLGKADDADNFRVWTDRERYRIGQNIRFHFEAEEPCYAVILTYTTAGQLIQVFPNHYRSNQFVQPGRRYEIPDEQMGFDLQVTGPVGTDTIIALVSGRPFDLMGEAFSENNPFLLVGEKDSSKLSDVARKIETLQHREIYKTRFQYGIQ